jgi:hypothetical protein
MIQQERIQTAPSYFDGIILKPLRNSGITAWVAGGSLRDYLIGIKPSDYDLFFPNQNEFQKAVNHFESVGAENIFESENGKKYRLGDNVFDLVKKFHNNAVDILKTFDFTAAQFSTDGQKLYRGQGSFKDLDGRNIVINKNKDREETVRKVLNNGFLLKYFNKGFKMPPQEVSSVTRVIKSWNAEDASKMTDLFKVWGSSPDVFKNADAVSSGEGLPEPEPQPQPQPQPQPEPEPEPIIPEKKDWVPWILAGMVILLSIVSENKQ